MKQHILDRLLRIAADRAAAPSGIRFTERQLYYELCRLLAPTHRAPRRFTFTVPAPLSYAAFRAALDRQAFRGLLTPNPPRTTRAGLHTPEPDLFDYGLPRLLVCESDSVAQMLRANGLPMESACPIFGASELPLDPGIAQMLTRAEGTIYLLHDASSCGLTFPARLTDLTEIPEGVRVVPLGLRPRQAGILHLTHLRDPIPSAIAAHVDPREREGSHRSESSAQTAHEDLLDLESGAGAAQTESSEREKSHHDPASQARAAHMEPYERRQSRPVPRAQTARMDSRERAELHDPESRAEAAQAESSWREGHPDSASNARATHVDPRERTQSRPVPRAEAARMDSWRGAELHDLESSARAAQVDPRERGEQRPNPVPRAQAAQLDSWERAWLNRGRFVEVEAVRPASLLRTVHRLVREVRPARTSVPELRRARTTGFMTWPAV
ncbi:hypothetical protein ACIBG0_18625 [Nocardia sp. NPDC050630]|uniref:hypothetical protein n=1 Tax=Nocardia sp. NPDC050630 TaxID=3364321 RepID=UPI0037B579DA